MSTRYSPPLRADHGWPIPVRQLSGSNIRKRTCATAALSRHSSIKSSPEQVRRVHRASDRCRKLASEGGPTLSLLDAQKGTRHSSSARARAAILAFRSGTRFVTRSFRYSASKIRIRASISATQRSPRSSPAAQKVNVVVLGLNESRRIAEQQQSSALGCRSRGASIHFWTGCEISQI